MRLLFFLHIVRLCIALCLSMSYKKSDTFAFEKQSQLKRPNKTNRNDSKVSQQLAMT